MWEKKKGLSSNPAGLLSQDGLEGCASSLPSLMNGVANEPSDHNEQ